MRPNLKNCTLGFGGALLLSLVLAGCGGDDQQSAKQQGGGQQQKPPAKAEVMEVEAHDVALSKEYPAQVRSNREVTVMGRVEGVLEARHYREGSMVEKGDKLFTIEQAPYEATVKQN